MLEDNQRHAAFPLRGFRAPWQSRCFAHPQFIQRCRAGVPL